MSDPNCRELCSPQEYLMQVREARGDACVGRVACTVGSVRGWREMDSAATLGSTDSFGEICNHHPARSRSASPERKKPQHK